MPGKEELRGYQPKTGGGGKGGSSGGYQPNTGSMQPKPPGGGSGVSRPKP